MKPSKQKQSVYRPLYRHPNEAEIKFGHGCMIYRLLIQVPVTKKFVTIDGVRWTVQR